MNTLYTDLHQRFEKWLQTIGYAQTTVYASTNYVRDFFTWLQANGINNLQEINSQVITRYHKYLQTKKNKRYPGSLSNNYIISNVNALRRFARYLEVTGQGTVEIELTLHQEKPMAKPVLTQADIRALYQACDSDYLGLRDRALLSVYYGCGLRRSEGQALNLADVLLKEKRLFVRKGKNYRQRYVPMTEAVKDDLENYMYLAREKILGFKPGQKPQALFLSMQVKRLCGNALINRIQKLGREAKINKEIGLHTLRHSIATHLLQSGMTLEEVSRFLGHSSLESTQIYTHLAHEEE